MVIELMNSRLILNRFGICGVPQFQGIYLKFYINTTGYNGDFYIFNLFDSTQVIQNKIISNFILKIEKYLKKNRDLKDILKFKKYKDMANTAQLDYITECYNKWIEWIKQKGLIYDI